MMNETLNNLIKSYATSEHSEFSQNLESLSKITLVAAFTDLLTMYMNDKNSSTLREFITVSIAGYSHNIGKIGYNGYKLSVAGNPINCEAKPKNCNTQDFIDFDNGERKSRPSKLNGGGNFTDYTWARYEKDKLNNVNMLISGFIDGKLIYVLELPFNSESFLKNLEEQLEKKFPNGDIEGYYLRSASFSFTNYKHEEKLEKIYVCNDIELYKSYINSELFNYLEGRIC